MKNNPFTKSFSIQRRFLALMRRFILRKSDGKLSKSELKPFKVLASFPPVTIDLIQGRQH